tara:strand:- start:505 stop:630 length:126 start_codon:yes stop_codon:yes gene_type:complete
VLDAYGVKRFNDILILLDSQNLKDTSHEVVGIKKALENISF